MKFLLICCSSLVSLFLQTSSMVNGDENHYLWLTKKSAETVITIKVPHGYQRINAKPDSWEEWLRFLPLMPAGSPVYLFNGHLKNNQDAHYRVLDIDVGSKDLQQCADSIIRLRAEYLFSFAKDKISFHFTSGDIAKWTQWRDGNRPIVIGNFVKWKHIAKADGTYANLKKYLFEIYRWAGTASLSKELKAVNSADPIQIGDIFIQGGSPGHAVIVVDVAENAKKERIFLLAQGYMPAQQMHVLKNPDFSSSPWYSDKRNADLVTPEWVFKSGSLKRFSDIERPQ